MFTKTATAVLYHAFVDNGSHSCTFHINAVGSKLLMAICNPFKIRNILDIIKEKLS